MIGSEPSSAFNSTETENGQLLQSPGALSFKQYSATAYQSIDAFDTAAPPRKSKNKEVDLKELAKKQFKLSVALMSLLYLVVILCLAFFVPRNIDAQISSFTITQNNFLTSTFSGYAQVKMKNNNFVTAQVSAQIIQVYFNDSIIAEAVGDPYTIPEVSTEYVFVPPASVPIKVRNAPFSNYLFTECITRFGGGNDQRTFQLDVRITIPVKVMAYDRTYEVAKSLTLSCGIVPDPTNPSPSPNRSRPPRPSQVTRSRAVVA